MLLDKTFFKKKVSLDSLIDKGIDQLFDKHRSEYDSIGDMLSQRDWDLSNEEILALIETELDTVNTQDDFKLLIKNLISNALMINSFVYSNYKYCDIQLSAYNIPDGNFVNCMAIAQLIHRAWDNLFYTETLAGITSQHFIAILPLPNGKFLSLDGKPNVLDIKDTPRFSTHPIIHG